MGASKSAVFTAEQNRLAVLAKAIAHPARIAILQVLAERKTCICNDFVEELPIAQATVSQHLKELKQAGIIRGEINPPKVCYCLDEGVFRELTIAFSGLFNQIKKSCC